MFDSYPTDTEHQDLLEDIGYYDDETGPEFEPEYDDYGRASQYYSDPDRERDIRDDR